MAEKPCYGDWVKCGPLGHGAFGEVTLWEKKATKQKIAVKTCRSDTELSIKNQMRWRQEVDILKKINHPNVIGSVILPDDLRGIVGSKLPALCMEYCEGGDLRKTLSTAENCCGLKQTMIIKVCKNIASAIQCLHGLDIAHRDLKPENIVIAGSENKIIFKVIDLGYAKQLDPSSSQHSYVGTAHYLAPEILMQSVKPYTKTVDYWSYGCLIYECCTGVRPFESCRSKEILKMVINKEERYISASLQKENDVDHLKFSDLLPEANQLDRILQPLFEKLLRLLLHGCPGKRGGDTQWIECVNAIIENRVLKVFCIDLCKEFVYQFSPTLSVAELQHLIYEDTQIPKEKQELFFVDGSLLESTLNYARLKDFIFVFNKDFKINNIVNCRQQLPSALRELLKCPCTFVKKSTAHHKDVYRQSVFFVQKQHSRNSDLTRGLKALVIYILNLRQRFSEIEKFQESVTALRTARAFFKLSLSGDVKNYQMYSQRNSLRNISQEQWIIALQGWKEMENIVDGHNLLTEECVKIFETRKSLQNQIVEIKAKDQINKTTKISNERTSKSVEEIRKIYSQVKTQGRWKDNVEELTFFMETFLQQMDKINQDFYKFFIEVINLRRQLKDFFLKLRLVEEKVKRSKEDVERMQLKRQEDLWQLLSTEETQTLRPNDVKPIYKRSTSGIVKENQKNVLRIKETLQNAKEQQKMFEQESQNFDWSFTSTSSER